jgi:hypothetical protein
MLEIGMDFVLITANNNHQNTVGFACILRNILDFKSGLQKMSSFDIQTKKNLYHFGGTLKKWFTHLVSDTN